jgi:hypothetical protein
MRSRQCDTSCRGPRSARIGPQTVCDRSQANWGHLRPIGTQYNQVSLTCRALHWYFGCLVVPVCDRIGSQERWDNRDSFAIDGAAKKEQEEI